MVEFAGLLFESLVVRDLRVYGQAAGCEISHYRDSDGLEANAIVRRAGGRWLPVEVKLGGEPARLVVVTAGGYGFEHPEGVTVVPITALGP